MCFGSNEVIVFSYDLRAKVTSGLWSTEREYFPKVIIDSITAETRHIQHPFFSPQQVLSGLVLTFKEKAREVLEAFTLALHDLKAALASSYVDSFEGVLLQANRGYIHVSTTIVGDLDNAVA